ncbi:Cof-type HAD-IIB family hydrolase [Clostridium sp. D2Q-11]|uniref:Cof-type HAD-IIB family hydrolase n=1 Tax=Anaeromonas frigoriresistens TaxID=2683708 RepID=A0A942UV49_9FIRM|nr:Cof-type HAD-IIB family hydrolase [Anaeromonas frigoriresistens]MBS4539158.1 Cof-type HAD-IIB family hydrolase [Anaeromonas frigoriresistens]
MKYKAIISDLDGTLLNSNHRVSEYTKSIVRKVIDRGIHFFIATGRHHKDIDYIRNDLKLDSIFITSNGCRVHDSNKNKLLGYDIEEDIVKGLLDLKVDENIHKNFYQEDKWFVEKENRWLDEFTKESNFLYEIVDFNNFENLIATKFFFLSEDHESLVKLQDRIEKMYPNRLNVAFSLINCLEIMPKGISKGHAIEKVLEKHNIKPQEAIAFGDGLNDLEMLKTVGKGYIMGNAHDKLIHALPDHDIIKPNTEEGLAKKLEELFL